MKKMNTVFAVASALAVAGCCCRDCCGDKPKDEAKRRTDLLYISHVHRGGGKFERPDNTLETFKWCWENGSALECDCRKTKDGVGIMLHDRTLKRTARGISPEMARKQVSSELLWSEIKDIDVGSYLKEINPSAGDYSDNRIPTIEATFAAMKGHPTYLCFVDEKGAGPGYIAKKAVEAGVQDQVYYTGQDYDKALEWTKVLPNGKTLIWRENAHLDRHVACPQAGARRGGHREVRGAFREEDGRDARQRVQGGVGGLAALLLQSRRCGAVRAARVVSKEDHRRVPCPRHTGLLDSIRGRREGGDVLQALRHGLRRFFD